MPRSVLLEFLSSKHLELAKRGYFQMTICQFGTQYPNSYIRLLKKIDEINVYHIKEPRIYQKSYEFEKLNSTILSLLWEMKEEIVFQKEELHFSLADPYYFKDLREQEFVKLQVTPIFHQEDMIGAILIYYQQNAETMSFTKNELSKLLEQLNIAESIKIERDIQEKLGNGGEYCILASRFHQVYLNENAKQYLKIDEDILSLKQNSVMEKFQYFTKQLGVSKLDYLDMDIYYIEKEKLLTTPPDLSLLSMYSLHHHQFGEKLSYLFFRKSPFQEDLSSLLVTISNWLKRLNMETQSQIFEYNDESCIVLIGKEVTIKEFTFLQKDCQEEYVVMLRTPTDIHSKMNLKKLSDFIYEVQPEKFLYQEYTEWLYQRNIESLSYKDNENKKTKNYRIFNAASKEVLCDTVFLPLRTKYRDGHFHSYQNSCEKILTQFGKLEHMKIMISIPMSLLSKRKTLESVKRILSGENILWLNILDDGKLSLEECMKQISKYKKMNVWIVCDSSIYLNYYNMSLFPLIDAIYIQNEEYQDIRNHEVGLPQAIFTYAIHEYKYIFIENFSPNEDADYNHPNCFYIEEVSPNLKN